MLVAAKMTQEQPLACWLRDHLWQRRGEERLVWNTVRAEHCSEDVKEWISNPSFDLTSSPPFLLRWLQVVAAGSVCTLMNKCDLILLSPDLEWNHNRCSSRCVYYSCNRLVDGFLQCLKRGGGESSTNAVPTVTVEVVMEWASLITVHHAKYSEVVFQMWRSLRFSNVHQFKYN